jgi:hypothetical protein
MKKGLPGSRSNMSHATKISNKLGIEIWNLSIYLLINQSIYLYFLLDFDNLKECDIPFSLQVAKWGESLMEWKFT